MFPMQLLPHRRLKTVAVVVVVDLLIVETPFTMEIAFVPPKLVERISAGIMRKSLPE